jgi:aryl-alcohol dehydrogenase-like predicted oxidoreductase
MFGGPDFLPSEFEQNPDPVPFEEQLSALQEMVEAGKVRYVGVSNETPYGVCSFAELAKTKIFPKIISIQNSYSLVNRKDYESGLAEACYHHKVGLLSYSPLAGGTLTGKYRGEPPKNARLMRFPGFMQRYLGSLNEAAVNAYCELAKESGLTPTQLALSWCYHRELVSSTIIGATTLEQVEENIKSYDVRLDHEVNEKISKIYQQFTDPTKAK